MNFTPFHTSLFTPSHHHEQVARALIEAGADVNHENGKHVTALNMACENGHEECAMLLLKAGARSDVKDDWGDTPLPSHRTEEGAEGRSRPDVAVTHMYPPLVCVKPNTSLAPPTQSPPTH